MKERKSKWRRRLLAALVTLLLAAIFINVGSWVYRQRDYAAQFQLDKGKLAEYRVTPRENRSASTLFDIELVNDRGLKVHACLSVPIVGDGPFPALLLLGGLRTGKHVLDYVGDFDNAILLGLDYPYEGKKGKMAFGEFLAKVPEMRRAVMNTVPAAMLFVDYLFARDDVDTDRITLIGGSIGALFAPAIAASDERITAVAILFGAGDLPALLAANIDLPPPIPVLASWLGGTLVSPLEPLKYIGRISPRPLFMLNGSDDPRMPERCSRLLHDKAGEPKTITWIPAGHIHVRSNEFYSKVRVLLEGWLIENRLIPPESTSVQIPPQAE